MLSRRQSQPGSKVTSGFEAAGIRHQRLDGRGCNGSNAGDRSQSAHVLVGLCRSNNGSFELVNLVRLSLDLIGNCRQGEARCRRQADICYIPYDCNQRLDLCSASGGNDAQLGQMRAQGVDRLRLLFHQKCATLQDHHCGSLLSRFDRNEAHGLASHSLADGLGIRRIRFSTLHKRFNVSWWDEPHFMAESCNLSCPIMSAATGFYSHKAGRLLREEMQHLAAP